MPPHAPELPSTANDRYQQQPADLPLGELGAELSAALRGLVQHEGYCLIGFDPVSGLRAFQTARDVLNDNGARLQLALDHPDAAGSVVLREPALRTAALRAGLASPAV